jgi:MFS family permease
MRGLLTKFRNATATTRVLIVGLVGGPLAGAAFAVLVWIVPSVVALFADPGQTGWNLFFLTIAATTGFLYGLVVGALVAGLTALVNFVAASLGGRRYAFIASGLTAAVGVAICSFLLIAPFWPSLLNPWIVSAVLAPITGVAFAAAARRSQPQRPTGPSPEG